MPGLHFHRLCQLDLTEGERLQYLDQKLADVTTFVPMAQFMAPEMIALLEEALPVKRSNKRSSEPLQAPPPKRYHPITPLESDSKSTYSPELSLTLQPQGFTSTNSPLTEQLYDSKSTDSELSHTSSASNQVTRGATSLPKRGLSPACRPDS